MVAALLSLSQGVSPFPLPSLIRAASCRVGWASLRVPSLRPPAASVTVAQSLCTARKSAHSVCHQHRGDLKPALSTVPQAQGWTDRSRCQSPRPVSQPSTQIEQDLCQVGKAIQVAWMVLSFPHPRGNPSGQHSPPQGQSFPVNYTIRDPTEGTRWI